jgi:hypothetical protein
MSEYHSEGSFGTMARERHTPSHDEPPAESVGDVLMLAIYLLWAALIGWLALQAFAALGVQWP